MDDMPHLWNDGDMATTYSTGVSDQSRRITAAQKRNVKVREQMQTYFARAAREDYSTLDAVIEEDLKKIFSTNVWGFREITLVITIARLLNTNYKASEDLYACKPRGLYEGPIRSELLEREIPHKLSGPLNVAKGTEKINPQWAAGREPRDVADAVVRLVEKIDTMPTEEIIILCRKQDIHPDIVVTTGVNSYFGKLEYRGLIFYYQDIYEWIMAQLLRIPSDARIEFYTKLNAYIQQPNIAEKVRIFWKQLHKEAASL